MAFSPLCRFAPWPEPAKGPPTLPPGRGELTQLETTCKCTEYQKIRLSCAIVALINVVNRSLCFLSAERKFGRFGKQLICTCLSL